MDGSEPFSRTGNGKDSCTALFGGVFVAGFECSEHRLEGGRRLSLLESTRHEEFAELDYARLRRLKFAACREGVSWVRSERAAGQYDFSSAARRLEAALNHGIEVIWDLMHFGWPDDVDIFAPSFPPRFARYARAFARWLMDKGVHAPMIAPINEISFLSWAGGDARCLNPFATTRGTELKVQLVRATIEAIEAVRDVLPQARFMQPEPLINFVATSQDPEHVLRAQTENLAQFQAWDMLSGRLWPSLGGHPKYLDVLGLNFYEHNQFTLARETVWRTDARYRPFSELVQIVKERYGRPMIVSETGSEDERRAGWLSYVADECVRALEAGCPIHAVTLYPILNHPGWLDDRHCHNGLWDYADDAGERALHEPLAREIEAHTPRLLQHRERMLQANHGAGG